MRGPALTRRLLALALAAAALGLSCEKDPPELTWFGVNTGHAMRSGTTQPADFYRSLTGMGGNVLREDVSWEQIEPIDDHWRWAQLDTEIRAAPDDVGVILSFLNSPIWARGSAHRSVCGNAPAVYCRMPPDAARLGEWMEFVEEAIRRYAGRVVAVEVWNEPNLAVFWRPGGDEPARWAMLIEATAEAVASTQPELPVISGGLSEVTPSPLSANVGTLGAEYLEAAYAARPDLAEIVDGIGVHPYAGQLPPDQAGNRFAATLEEIRQVRDRVDPQTPLWATETGYFTVGPDAVTETQQRDWLLEIHRQLAAAPDVEAMVIHTLVDPVWVAPQAHPKERSFGIMRATDPPSPKPAWTAFHDLLGP